MTTKKPRYPALCRTHAFEKWAVAADHALLAALWSLGDGMGCIDITRLIDQARELLADGRGERK